MDSGSNRRVRAFLLLKMAENSAKKKEEEEDLTSSLLLTTSFNYFCDCCEVAFHK